MNPKRSVLAALAALSITLGAAPLAPSAHAGAVPAEQVAGSAAVGVVKEWDAKANPTMTVSGNKPQSWTQQVDHHNVLSYKVYSPSMDLSLIHI